MPVAAPGVVSLIGVIHRAKRNLVIREIVGPRRITAKRQDPPTTATTAASAEGQRPDSLAHTAYDGHTDEHRITLRTPAELADALPYLLGYRPEDSIVLVALHDRDGAEAASAAGPASAYPRTRTTGTPRPGNWCTVW
ncbi:hypothetical protein SFUMM280S_03839 [Streptomyces fumanus]